MEIKIATRKSPLALYQAEAVKQAIIDKHPDCICELIPLDSEGDKDLRPIHELGGKGVFVKRLEEALVMGDADIAVHSLKDVPADLNDEFQIVATLERANPSDSIIFKESITLDQLEDKSIVATSSPRRAAQVKLFNPSLEVCPVRGNIHTRIKKLKDNEFDALVIATAALDRLQLNLENVEKIDSSIMLPAATQAIIGIEVGRDINPQKLEIIKSINHHETYFIASVERKIIKYLEGDCNSAIALICKKIKESTFEVNLRAFDHKSLKVEKIDMCFIGAELDQFYLELFNKIEDLKIKELISN